MGRYVINNGTVYEGQIKNYQMNGYGRFIYTNGDYYVGNFLNHKKHGQGKYVSAKTGQVQEGAWSNDKFAGAGGQIDSTGANGLTPGVTADPERAGHRATVNASLAEFARSAFSQRRSSSLV